MADIIYFDEPVTQKKVGNPERYRTDAPKFDYNRIFKPWGLIFIEYEPGDRESYLQEKAYGEYGTAMHEVDELLFETKDAARRFAEEKPENINQWWKRRAVIYPLMSVDERKEVILKLIEAAGITAADLKTKKA